MAYGLDICDAPVTCHAWNKDCSLLALCPNTSDILIYAVTGKKIELKYTLKEHTQIVTSIDWHPTEDRFVSCSQDRNAYVWTFNKARNTYDRALVILKLKRAATYCRWSPNGTKFVVATGTGKCRVCYWQEEHNWWNAFTVNHLYPTGLTADFFKDDNHILVSSTARHCDYLSTDEDELRARKEAKKKDSKKKESGKKESGKQELITNHVIEAFKSQGWTNCSALSPSEEWIAFASQDSYIRFIKYEEFKEIKEAESPVRAININGLPLLSMVFLSDKCLVGAGFDCVPRLFHFNGEEWKDLGLIDIPDIRDSSTQKQTGGLASKMAAFGGKQVQAASKTIHNNIILGVRRHKDGFSCNANDGVVSVWPMDAIKKHFKNIALE